MTLIAGSRTARAVETAKKIATQAAPAMQPTHAEIPLEHEAAALQFHTYSNYPQRSVQCGSVAGFVEGTIHWSDEEIQTFVLDFLRTEDGAKRAFARQLAEVDGEFVLVFPDPERASVWVLNDTYGHLPLYYCRSAGAAVISREFPIACALADSASPERLQIAAFLTFNFVPGDGTLHPGVQCLDGGSVVEVGAAGSRILGGGDWRQSIYGTRADTENLAVELADELVEATRWRIRSGSGIPVISLSGGYDSRAVTSALLRCGISGGQAATFLDAAGSARFDLPTARRVAELANLPWRAFDLSPPAAADERELFRLKMGMNSPRMAFLLPFLRALIQEYGKDLLYLTGDTGLALRDVLPARRIRSAGAFIDDMFGLEGRFHRHPIYDPSAACRAVGISRAEFDDWLLGEARARAGIDDWARVFKSFILDNYGRRWHYEGMDRNRAYCLTVTPLEATRFMRIAYTGADSTKSRMRLFSSLLRVLDPQLATVPKGGEKYAVGSRGFRRAQLLRSLFQSLPPTVVREVRRWRGKSLQRRRPDAFPLPETRMRWRESGELRDVLDFDSIAAATDSIRCYWTLESLVRFWQRLSND